MSLRMSFLTASQETEGFVQYQQYANSRSKNISVKDDHNDSNEQW